MNIQRKHKKAMKKQQAQLNGSENVSDGLEGLDVTLTDPDDDEQTDCSDEENPLHTVVSYFCKASYWDTATTYHFISKFNLFHSCLLRLKRIILIAMDMRVAKAEEEDGKLEIPNLPRKFKFLS